MTRPDLIVCLPDFDRIPAEHQAEARRMNTTLIDCSGKAKHKHNERMGHEEKVDPAMADPNFPEAATHRRLGPWVIEGGLDVEVYEPVVYGGFENVYVFHFFYSPLPDGDNPWVPMKRLSVDGMPEEVKREMGRLHS